MKDLSEYLAPFHAGEEALAYTSSIIIGDRASHKIVSSWTMMPVKWIHPSDEIPEDERLLWDWLWKGVNMPWVDLANRSGLDMARVQKIFEPLRANRLVYPDGTAAKHALGVLKAEVVKGLNQSKKR